MGIETAQIGQAFQAVGTGFSAYGAYSNSRNAGAAYAAQGQVAANNAKVAGWQAEDALARGARAASTARMRTRQLKGTQRAALAANGVDLGVGSALDILTDTDYFGEIDAATITDNAAKEAWAIRQQAAGFESEAALLRSVGDMQSPALATGTSLLTSAGKVASNWYKRPAGDGASSGDGMGQGDRRKIGVY